MSATNPLVSIEATRLVSIEATSLAVAFMHMDEVKASHLTLLSGRPPRKIMTLPLGVIHQELVAVAKMKDEINQAHDNAYLASTLTRWDYLMMAIFGADRVAKRIKKKAEETANG